MRHVSGIRVFSLLISFLLLFSCALAQEQEILESAQANCEANVRLEPTTRSEIVFILETGERVNIYETVEVQGQTWYFIRVSSAPQRKGYVLSELLDIEPEPIPQTAFSPSFVEATGNSREVDLAYYLAAVSQGEPALEDRFSADELARYETLKTDSRGEDVLALKNRLYTLGFYAKEQTGPLYTDSTKQVLARFQKINGLPSDGVADPLTQALLFSDLALGADAETDDSRPVCILDGRIVRYDSSSAVQIELLNQSRETITGFSLQIIPYSTYEKPVALGATLAQAVEKTWSCSGILLQHKGTYDCAEQKEYFVIFPGSIFSGALVSVSSYTNADGQSVSIDPARRDWYVIGTADAAGMSLPEPILMSQADRARAASWSLGFSASYVLPAWQYLYGAPEGAVVTETEVFSYAAAAGLQTGDVILALNGIRITGEDSLLKAKALIAPGDSFELIYWRSGSYFASALTR